MHHKALYTHESITLNTSSYSPQRLAPMLAMHHKAMLLNVYIYQTCTQRIAVTECMHGTVQVVLMQRMPGHTCASFPYGATELMTVHESTGCLHDRRHAFVQLHNEQQSLSETSSWLVGQQQST